MHIVVYIGYRFMDVFPNAIEEGLSIEHFVRKLVLQKLP